MQVFQLSDTVKIIHGGRQAEIGLNLISCPSDWDLDVHQDACCLCKEIDYTRSPASQSKTVSDSQKGRLFVNAMLYGDGTPAVKVSLDFAPNTQILISRL